MNTSRYDRLWELAKDPLYVRFMEVTFPLWMSHTPGGINYLPERYTIDERVERWHMACANLRDEAEYLKIRLDGFPQGQQPSYLSAERLAVKCATSSNMRSLRNNWKDAMKSLGLPYGDQLWRLPRRSENEWGSEWPYFVNMVQSVYGEKLQESSIK